MMPLYGFLQGDTIGLLILAEETDTMQILADKLQAAASVRVRPRASVRVFYKDRELKLRATVAGLGIAALDRLDFVRGDPS